MYRSNRTLRQLLWRRVESSAHLEGQEIFEHKRMSYPHTAQHWPTKSLTVKCPERTKTVFWRHQSAALSSQMGERVQQELQSKARETHKRRLPLTTELSPRSSGVAGQAGIIRRC
jgi:hypothetical protein